MFCDRRRFQPDRLHVSSDRVNVPDFDRQSDSTAPGWSPFAQHGRLSAMILLPESLSKQEVKMLNAIA